MKVYTKQGDTGKTSLLNKRVSKTNVRIEANGQLDELMVMLAFLLEELKDEKEEKLYMDIRKVYKTIFKIMTMIADVKNDFGYTINDEEINKLEKDIDKMSETLPKLKNFIYYTGSKTSMLCQQIRAKVRSVERIVDKVNEEEEEVLESIILIYLNRLSDYFYTLGRYINLESGNEEDTFKIK